MSKKILKKVFSWQIIEFLNDLLEFFENLLEFVLGLSFFGLRVFFEMSKKKPESKHYKGRLRWVFRRPTKMFREYGQLV